VSGNMLGHGKKHEVKKQFRILHKQELHGLYKLPAVDSVARMRRLYNTGIGLTTGLIGSQTVTHNYSIYTLQLTTIESIFFH
jgi:hypothetical protein